MNSISLTNRKEIGNIHDNYGPRSISVDSLKVIPSHSISSAAEIPSDTDDNLIGLYHLL
jgi:hypothetical protein